MSSWRILLTAKLSWLSPIILCTAAAETWFFIWVFDFWSTQFLPYLSIRGGRGFRWEGFLRVSFTFTPMWPARYFLVTINRIRKYRHLIQLAVYSKMENCMFIFDHQIIFAFIIESWSSLKITDVPLFYKILLCKMASYRGRFACVYTARYYNYFIVSKS